MVGNAPRIIFPGMNYVMMCLQSWCVSNIYLAWWIIPAMNYEFWLSQWLKHPRKIIRWLSQPRIFPLATWSVRCPSCCQLSHCLRQIWSPSKDQSPIGVPQNWSRWHDNDPQVVVNLDEIDHGMGENDPKLWSIRTCWFSQGFGGSQFKTTQWKKETPRLVLMV